MLMDDCGRAVLTRQCAAEADRALAAKDLADSLRVDLCRIEWRIEDALAAAVRGDGRLTQLAARDLREALAICRNGIKRRAGG